MMNAGFLEVFKKFGRKQDGHQQNQNDSYWDCVVFHDVDVYMEDDRNIIHCREKNHVHLGASIDRWNYT